MASTRAAEELSALRSVLGDAISEEELIRLFDSCGNDVERAAERFFAGQAPREPPPRKAPFALAGIFSPRGTRSPAAVCVGAPADGPSDPQKLPVREHSGGGGGPAMLSLSVERPRRVVGPRANQPLADRMRPATIDDVVGQSALCGPGTPFRAMLESDTVSCVVLLRTPPCLRWFCDSVLTVATGGLGV